jgi:hypothetical protein
LAPLGTNPHCPPPPLGDKGHHSIEIQAVGVTGGHRTNEHRNGARCRIVIKPRNTERNLRKIKVGNGLMYQTDLFKTGASGRLSHGIKSQTNMVGFATLEKLRMFTDNRHRGLPPYKGLFTGQIPKKRKGPQDLQPFVRDKNKVAQGFA